MRETFRLRILGPFELLAPDGRPVELVNKKARALLAYLAVEHERAHARERLAGMLWGETGDERARHNLRQSLSAIRRLCGELVVSEGDLLRLHLERCNVDLVELERSPGRCLETIRGELLEDLDIREPVYDAWLLLARGRVKKLACEAVDERVRRLSADDRNDEAIEALERRLAMDPCCEAAHRRMMELLAGAGRRSDALRQYQVCVETLERELGAGPAAATRDLHARLRGSEGPAAPAAKSSKPKLAVLPFDNLGGNEESYFADGIVEDITTALSCFHSLTVIARSASFAYRDRELPDRQIADELGVQFLLRGSVRRAGNRVRVGIQLLDAIASAQLWGHRFDRDYEDVFEVQDEIASTVVSTLAGKVEAARLTHTRSAPPQQLDAYDLYLRGKQQHHRYTADSCRACIDLFGRAVERDPDFAVAHAWLACGLGQAMLFDPDNRASLVDRAQAAAERGLELDENESECHRILAQVFLIRGDLKKSLRHQERALFLNPNDDRSLCAMGEILVFVGRHDEAEGWVRKAMQLNPYHPERYWTHLGRALFHRGEFDESLAASERIARPRTDDLAYRVAVACRSGNGEALSQARSALLEANPEFDPPTFVASLPYEREQDRAALLGALTEAGLSD
jgi:TolB-like protein